MLSMNAPRLRRIALPGFLALGLVFVLPAASSRVVSAEPAGCVSETGTGGACVDGSALDGATGVSVSPDGTSVYVASETSRAVAVFSRDAATGAIAQHAGTDGSVSESGTGGACADGTALVGPRSLALSPDGENLYFPPRAAAHVTAGSFSLSFDGSDVALGEAPEDVDAAAVDASGRIYLSTLDTFAVPGLSGQDEDVFVFMPTTLDPPTTAGTYSSTLFFDGSSFGLGANDVFAIDVPPQPLPSPR
jgi:sugar lactone lactonase YvrE